MCFSHQFLLFLTKVFNGFQHQNLKSIFFKLNGLVREAFDLIKATSLVVSDMGFHICVPGMILTRIEFFPLIQLHFVFSYEFSISTPV